VTEAETEVVAMAIATKKGLAGALLPILHTIQDHLGFVPPEAVAPIAESLNLSQAEVHGVISFYHDFRSKPPGRNILKVCRAEACQAVGANRLIAHLEQTTGAALGSTNFGFTMEAAYCLGLCASGPAALVNGKPVARLTLSRADELIASLTAET
jgi:formate dehydrogenase subunit gamma